MSVKHGKEIPDLKHFDLVISTNTFDEALSLSEKCRKTGVKFIYAQSCGVSGVYFSDLGK